VAVWIIAVAALTILLVRRRAARRDDLRIDFALTLGVALLFSPHLFVQDTVMWIVVLALYGAVVRERSPAWQRFAAFALSWPFLFAVSRAVDLGRGRGPMLRVDPVIAAMLVSLIVIGHGALKNQCTAGEHG
jgi:hypothetical protein